MKLSDLAQLLGAELYRDGDPIEGVAPLHEARPGQLSLFTDLRYEAALAQTQASALILASPRPELPQAQLIHPQPMLAFARLLEVLYPLERPAAGVHATAVVSELAHLGEGVSVGPGAVIEAGATIGAGSVVGAGCFLGKDVVLGEECWLHPRAVVMAGSRLGRQVILHPGVVIGADGFGYRWDGERHVKVPQVGRVVIEDDVEIGAGSTVDRGTVGDTVIGRGSRLDNLVHVGHNVQVGPDCLLIAQVGIAGSTRLGRGVILAGQVGVADHAVLGDGVLVSAKSGVHGEVAAGSRVAGIPAMPHNLWRKVMKLLPELPGLFSRVKDLESRAGGADTDPTPQP